MKKKAILIFVLFSLYLLFIYTSIDLKDSKNNMTVSTIDIAEINSEELSNHNLVVEFSILEGNIRTEPVVPILPSISELQGLVKMSLDEILTRNKAFIATIENNSMHEIFLPYSYAIEYLDEGFWTETPFDKEVISPNLSNIIKPMT